MKYLAYSILIHLFMVMIVIFSNDQGTATLSEQPVSIEIVSNQPKKGVAPSASKASKFTKSLKKTSKMLAQNAKDLTQRKKNLEQPADKTKKSGLEQKSAGQKVTLTYTQELKLFLEQYKHYPRQAIRLKQSGVVQIKVKIDSQGKFSDIKLAQASNFPLLDQAALNLLKKLGQFKPLPKSIPADSNFTIPIAYIMGKGRLR